MASKKNKKKARKSLKKVPLKTVKTLTLGHAQWIE